jgi:hypothetical protein
VHGRAICVPRQGGAAITGQQGSAQRQAQAEQQSRSSVIPLKSKRSSPNEGSTLPSASMVVRAETDTSDRSGGARSSVQ